MIYLDNIGVIRNKEEILANFNFLFEDKRIYGISGTNTQSRTLLEIIMLFLSQTIEDNLKFILEMS